MSPAFGLSRKICVQEALDTTQNYMQSVDNALKSEIDGIEAVMDKLNKMEQLTDLEIIKTSCNTLLEEFRRVHKISTDFCYSLNTLQTLDGADKADLPFHYRYSLMNHIKNLESLRLPSVAKSFAHAHLKEALKYANKIMYPD